MQNSNEDDSRIFVCKNCEVFSSLSVRRNPLIRIGKWGLFYLYDILCAKDFNPNERTDFVFSKDNPKLVLAGQLRCAVLSFYKYPGPDEKMQTEPAAITGSLATE